MLVELTIEDEKCESVKSVNVGTFQSSFNLKISILKWNREITLHHWSRDFQWLHEISISIGDNECYIELKIRTRELCQNFGLSKCDFVVKSLLEW